MKRRTIRPILVLSVLCAMVGAPAQYEGAASPTQPWDELKPNSKCRVKLNFVNAGIEAMIRFFSMTASVTIAKDPGPTGTVTLVTPEAVSLSEAFAILEASLELKG